MSRPGYEDVTLAFADGPGEGDPTGMEVAPGLWWIRVPLPIRLRIVNIWWLAEADGSFTAIDTGFHTDDTVALWDRMLERRSISRLVLTHYHPDHSGLSGLLQRRFGLIPWMPQMEWTLHYMLGRLSDAIFAEEQDRFYRKYGMAADARGIYRGRGNPYRRSVRFTADEYRRIADDGQMLTFGQRQWRMIRGEGHSPEHASFYCPDDKILIAGDQVLPKITPNTSLFWFGDGDDPLGTYLASLDRFADLPSDTLVLPSHRDPFYGLHDRIKTLKDHHEERLDHTLEGFADGPATNADICRHLFSVDQLDFHQLTFAFGEALAHVVHLERRGLVHRIVEPGQPVRFARS